MTTSINPLRTVFRPLRPESAALWVLYLLMGLGYLGSFVHLSRQSRNLVELLDRGHRVMLERNSAESAESATRFILSIPDGVRTDGPMRALFMVDAVQMRLFGFDKLQIRVMNHSEFVQHSRWPLAAWEWLDLPASSTDQDTPVRLEVIGLGAERTEIDPTLLFRRVYLFDEGTLEWGQWIGFGQSGTGHTLTGSGWSRPEKNGRWTVGKEASLLLRLKPTAADSVILEIDAFAHLAPTQPEMAVGVGASGRSVAQWPFKQGTPSPIQPISIPRKFLSETGPTEIGFLIEDPLPPLKLGISEDPRPIGLFFRRIRVIESPSTHPQSENSP